MRGKNIGRKGENERRMKLKGVCEEVEMYRRQNGIRKFYLRIKRQSEGFGNGICICKVEERNLLTDTEKVMERALL